MSQELPPVGAAKVLLWLGIVFGGFGFIVLLRSTVINDSQDSYSTRQDTTSTPSFEENVSVPNAPLYEEVEHHKASKAKQIAELATARKEAQERMIEQRAILDEAAHDCKPIIIQMTREIDPRSRNSANAYRLRGLAYCAMGDLDNAIEDYEKAVRLDQNYSPAHSILATMRKEKDILSRANEDHFFRIRSRRELSMLYCREGLANNCIFLFTAAIRLDPRSAEAYQRRCEAYQRLGNEQKAIADLMKAEELGRKSE